MTREPEFRLFNPEGQLYVYVCNLPHWRQPGATYFVTFRQADSIPSKVVAALKDLRRRFLDAHGIDPSLLRSGPNECDSAYMRIPLGIRRQFERQQAALVHRELDRCHGSCVLRHRPIQSVLCNSMVHFHGTRLWMGDYVIMPNHVHAIVLPWDAERPVDGSPGNGWELEDLLGSIKKWSARRINALISHQQVETVSEVRSIVKAPFWQQESYDRIMRDQEELAAFRRYIARNPEEAKVRQGQYAYHAASWLDKFAERPRKPYTT